MATAPPSADTITVSATLELLDKNFKMVAAGVAEDRYALWLGSGISFGRVEGLRQVIGRVLEFLRSQVDHGDPNCRYLKALKEALSYANPTAAEKAAMDFTQPVPSWAVKDAIKARLVNNYARLLDVTVQGKEEDYILWEGVNVCSTFADPTLTPDVEHLCIAVLVLEGVASTIASANWDGLIEKAVHQLSGRAPVLSICGRPADLQQPPLRAKLIKFHGCAVLAKTNEADYRPFLVGSWSQITSLCTRPENAALVNRLLDIISTRPTLMMGLSAQDADIQAIFAKASANLAWTWPGERPSYAFSEDELGGDQKSLLKNVYRDQMNPANREEIFETARIQAYAKPLLLALVLHVLCSKMQVLANVASGLLTPAERAHIQDGLIAIRDQLGAAVGTDMLAFLNTFLDRHRLLMQLVRYGKPTVGAPYHPLTTDNALGILGNVDHGASGIPELAVAAGLLGKGASNGDWQVVCPTTANPHEGMFLIKAAGRDTKAFITANVQTALELEQEGLTVPSEAPIVIQCQRRVPRMPRSPRGVVGRTGKAVVREVSIASLLESATTFSELFDRFRLEASI